jgi:ferredoxin
MIVADRKPLAEIEAMLIGTRRVLVAGCGTCVAVCLAGGEREAQILAEELRLQDRLKKVDRRIDEVVLTRQCDREYLDVLEPHVSEYDALLSMGCGAGVQLLAERYDRAVVLPALNTRFIGVSEGPGIFVERCVACADCELDETGGICPMTRCAKSLLNGPCGGTNHGRCEVDAERDCAWTLIYRKMEALGRLERLLELRPPKDHRPAQTPGRFVHPAYAPAAPDGKQR